MGKKNILQNSVLYVSLLAFIAFVVYVFCINQEVLYTAHDRSEFIIGSPFFNTLMLKPFGLMQYVGAWLTQFLYKPAVGASILSAIWVLIYLVGVKAFRLKASASALMLLPIACLLTSIVDLGYWVYISKIRGYWFSQSVGYLAMLILLWVARSTPRRWHLVWYVVGACLYPVLGWFALLFVLCLALIDKVSWREILALALLLLTAKTWGILLYSHLKPEDVVLAGFPRFETPSDKTDSLSIPFLLLGVLSVLITLLGRYSAKWFVPVVSVVAGVVFTWSFMYQDKNYVNEMRMVRFAEEDNWKEVVNVFKEAKQPTVSMVMLKNVALMNDGTLLDRSFKLGNNGFPINTADILHVSFLNIASPLVYYNYGMLNEAYRLGIENCIQEGFSPFFLKTLSRCALANGEMEVLERYNTLLHHHPYYKNWQAAKATNAIKELNQSFPDEISGVENSDSYVVNSISLWNDSCSKVVSEQSLFYSMIKRSPQLFWPSLRNYLNSHMGENFPLHAQEAYILYMDKAPEKRRMMLPVEESIYERYVKFWEAMSSAVKPGLKLKDIEGTIRKDWGDTYWYYYVFATKNY